MRNRLHAVVLAQALLALVAAPGSAQPPQQGDLALAEVDRLLREAQREIDQFQQAGGRKDDARHPVASWVDKLWALRSQAPGTRAAGKATAEAIHLLIHADRIQEAETRADGLAVDDPAWGEALPRILFEAASFKKDYRFLILELEKVATERKDPGVRGSLLYYLGRGHAKGDDRAAARTAFKSAIAEAKGTPVAKDAETELYKLDNLGYGDPAPAFTATARDGSQIEIAAYRGRVVLLVFWSST